MRSTLSIMVVLRIKIWFHSSACQWLWVDFFFRVTKTTNTHTLTVVAAIIWLPLYEISFLQDAIFKEVDTQHYFCLFQHYFMLFSETHTAYSNEFLVGHLSGLVWSLLTPGSTIEVKTMFSLHVTLIMFMFFFLTPTLGYHLQWSYCHCFFQVASPSSILDDSPYAFMQLPWSQCCLFYLRLLIVSKDNIQRSLILTWHNL